MARQSPCPPLALDPADGTLLRQLERAIVHAIAERRLRPGDKLWSIRGLARQQGISTFTVAEAYDRLVAAGALAARRGDGFYVAADTGGRRHERETLQALPVDAFWLVDSLYEPPAEALKPGSGWLPAEWYAGTGLNEAMRRVARQTSGATLAGYGEGRGLPALRAHLARQLSDEGLPVTPDQLVLTQGASQALSLAASCLSRPGDVVLMDDPGYCNLVTGLPLHELQLIGVPWDGQGPDLAVLEALLERHRPKIFFTNPRLHNPTGASYSATTAYRVLQLAEQYDFWIVEDDVCAGLTAGTTPTMAKLDGLKRVIYIGSCSKTLAPGLRVGHMAADRSVADALVHHKMITGLTSSELSERVALAALTDGQQRRRLTRLQARLADCRKATLAMCERLGMDVFAAGNEGMFVWARLPAGHDPAALAGLGVKQGIMLAPGALFRPGHQYSPYLRLNVAYSTDPRVEAFLAGQLR